MSAPEEFCFF